MSKHVIRRKCNNLSKSNNIIKNNNCIQYAKKCRQSMDYKFHSESEVRESSMMHPLSTSSNNFTFYKTNYFSSLKFEKGRASPTHVV